MTKLIETKTKHLILRQWRLSDFDFFAEINSSKKVMQFFPKIMARQDSDEFAQRILDNIADNGWGFWAVEIPEVCEFIGFVGLNKPNYELPFSKNKTVIEIGWRLSEKYWNNGYATEAARTALSIGFTQLQFSEIISFTPVINLASKKVMQKLKMQNTNTFFNHPKISEGHELRKHCLYKMKREDWVSAV